MIKLVEGLPRPADLDEVELADRALLHGYISDVIRYEGDEGALLTGALRGLAHHQRLDLHGGATRIGWVVAHLADGEIADRVISSIDETVLRALDDWHGPYDLIGGLVGFGVYALERHEHDHTLANRVIHLLEESARARGDGVGWFTGPELLPEHQRELAPSGYWNLGVAHGIPGVIALLAQYVRAGVEVDRAQPLLERAVAYLVGAVPKGGYPRWHTDDGPTEPPVGLAWCYGDLGISIALLAAARACERADWNELAMLLIRACAALAPPRSGGIEVGLCHGSAGIAHLFHRCFLATGDPASGTASRHWLAATIATLSQTSLPNSTLLTGATGVALVLHSFISDLTPDWDRLLLADPL